MAQDQVPLFTRYLMHPISVLIDAVCQSDIKPKSAVVVAFASAAAYTDHVGQHQAESGNLLLTVSV